MKFVPWSAITSISIVACTASVTPTHIDEVQRVVHPQYTVVLPPEPRATIVLFPCFSCDAADTQAEFLIPKEAIANDVAVVLMEANERIFLTAQETGVLADSIEAIMSTLGLGDKPVVYGGFSSGGNVAVLLAKEQQRAPRASIDLRGLFVVDSPLDLAHLYRMSEKHQEHPVEGTAGEARMVVRMLGSTLGTPTDSLHNYEACSPISESEQSIVPLKELAIRIYTEPDTAWWMENRGYSYEELNAARLEDFHEQLLRMGHQRAELVITSGRGVQRGDRHPHAWSIVEEKELVRWVLSLQ